MALTNWKLARSYLCVSLTTVQLYALHRGYDKEEYENAVNELAELHLQIFLDMAQTIAAKIKT